MHILVASNLFNAYKPLPNLLNPFFVFTQSHLTPVLEMVTKNFAPLATTLTYLFFLSDGNFTETV